jgi:hypothetical protein
MGEPKDLGGRSDTAQRAGDRSGAEVAAKATHFQYANSRRRCKARRLETLRWHGFGQGWGGLILGAARAGGQASRMLVPARPVAEPMGAVGGEGRWPLHPADDDLSVADGTHSVHPNAVVTLRMLR